MEQQEAAVSEAPQKLLFNTYVAGVAHYPGATSSYKLLAPGSELILEREPTNQYDSNAVKVLASDRVQVGYVPGKFTQIFGTLMDNGVELRAIITASMLKQGQSKIFMNLLLV